MTESLFDIVQVVLSKPKRNPNVSSRKYLLTSHVECDCSAPVVGTCLNQTYRYYRCRSTWPTSTRPRTCDASYIEADLLEQEVWKAATEVLERPEVVAEELESKRGAPYFVMTDDTIDRFFNMGYTSQSHWGRALKEHHPKRRLPRLGWANAGEAGEGH